MISSSFMKTVFFTIYRWNLNSQTSFRIDNYFYNNSWAISINKNIFTYPTELHAIINADPTSNSLQEHLASIVKLDAQMQTPPDILSPETQLSSGKYVLYQ